MFRSFSNALDELLRVQEAVEAARRSDYFGRSTTSRGSYPSINLFQEGDNTVLTAEFPGVKKDDIAIEIKDNLIRLSGERRLDYPEKASVHRVERRNVKFDRTVKIPSRVEMDKVKAEYNDGILKVVLPRAEADKPKQISIN
jgi:HSP20 family protein